jgi:AcrR family transcriptional regulator
VPDDGRVRRGVATRDRIVEAVIELVRGGTPRPSAAQIAAVAGTGTRTVFRRFRDLEELFQAVGARIQAEILPLIDQRSLAGPIEARARELVRRRSRVYERLGPFRVSAMPHRHGSVVIQSGQQSLDGWHRAQLRTTFEPELRRAPGDLVEALDAVTSFETWHRLRTTQRLGAARARAVMERAVLGLLATAGEGAGGT